LRRDRVLGPCLELGSAFALKQLRVAIRVATVRKEAPYV